MYAYIEVGVEPSGLLVRVAAVFLNSNGKSPTDTRLLSWVDRLVYAGWAFKRSRKA
jgi:hypothetical protein